MKYGLLILAYYYTHVKSNLYFILKNDFHRYFEFMTERDSAT